MTLKYQAQLGRCADCPPAASVVATCTAFRFVHSPLSSASFEPVAILDSNLTSAVCITWSLSMFVGEAKAVKRYKNLIQHRPELRKKLGTHLAAGDLCANDGVVTRPSKDGHFELFEAADCNLAPRFAILRAL